MFLHFVELENSNAHGHVLLKVREEVTFQCNPVHNTEKLELTCKGLPKSTLHVLPISNYKGNINQSETFCMTA